MTMTPKVPTDVQMNVTIPNKTVVRDAPQRIQVHLANTLVTLQAGNQSITFARADLDEALRVLGYKPGPVYRNAGSDAAALLRPLGRGQQAEREGTNKLMDEAGQAQRAAARVPGFDEHVGDRY